MQKNEQNWEYLARFVNIFDLLLSSNTVKYLKLAILVNFWSDGY